MRFRFSAEQLAFRDSVADLLEKECPPQAVRQAWTNDNGRVPGLWDTLVATGFIGEADPVDAVLVIEETGRACVPEPVVEAWATERPETTLALAVSPLALYADSATTVAVEHEGALVTGVVGDPCPSVDGSRRLFTVHPTGTDLDLDLDRVRERAVVAAAAQLTGLARSMIDLTVLYATERRQFGVPIGTFQAVKHHLADAALTLEFARPLVHRAAWCLATGDDERHTAASLAKAFASEAATTASRVALQVHGAIGYAYEYDLHLWLKRAWALAATWGDASWHRNRIAATLGVT